MTLQVHPYRIGEAEEHAGRRGVKGIVAAKHDRYDGDPAPARAHVLRKDADRAKRELRPGKTGKRAGDEHRDYPVADDVDAERARRFRLLAYATQPQSDWRAELNNADKRRERPSGPRYSGLACEGPAEQHHRLAGGTVLHVSVWRHPPEPRPADALVPLPHADGWTQLLAGAPAPAAR